MLVNTENIIKFINIDTNVSDLKEMLSNETISNALLEYNNENYMENVETDYYSDEYIE